MAKIILLENHRMPHSQFVQRVLATCSEIGELIEIEPPRPEQSATRRTQNIVLGKHATGALEIANR